jgi:hypothetical protein
MLAGADVLLRELPSAMSRSLVELRGAIRPPVMWRQTRERRLRTGDSATFICAPPERRYDTPLAQLVKLALHQLTLAYDEAALAPIEGIGTTLARRVTTASRLQRHAKLREVRLVRSLPAHALHGASRFAAAAPIAQFVNLYREAVEDQSPESVRDVVTRQLLVPRDPDRLFELYVGLEIVRSLEGVGYTRSQHRLHPNRGLPFARLRRGNEELSLWYQRPIGKVFDAPGGRYRDTLYSAGLTASSLRPDFVLVRHPTSEALIVEVKYTARDVDTADRVGIKDAFTYLHDSDALLSAKPKPRALVVGWNSIATPVAADVVVASQRNVGRAVELVLREWDRACNELSA